MPNIRRCEQWRHRASQSLRLRSLRLRSLRSKTRRSPWARILCIEGDGDLLNVRRVSRPASPQTFNSTSSSETLHNPPKTPSHNASSDTLYSIARSTLSDWTTIPEQCDETEIRRSRKILDDAFPQQPNDLLFMGSTIYFATDTAKRYPYARITHLSPTNIEIHPDDTPENCCFQEGSLRDSPWAKPQDFILLRDIQDVSDWRELFSNVKKSLRAGGVAHLVVTNASKPIHTSSEANSEGATDDRGVDLTNLQQCFTYAEFTDIRWCETEYHLDSAPIRSFSITGRA